MKRKMGNAAIIMVLIGFPSLILAVVLNNEFSFLIFFISTICIFGIIIMGYVSFAIDQRMKRHPTRLSYAIETGRNIIIPGKYVTTVIPVKNIKSVKKLPEDYNYRLRNILFSTSLERKYPCDGYANCYRIHSEEIITIPERIKGDRITIPGIVRLGDDDEGNAVRMIKHYMDEKDK